MRSSPLFLLLLCFSPALAQVPTERLEIDIQPSGSCQTLSIRYQPSKISVPIGCIDDRTKSLRFATQVQGDNSSLPATTAFVHDYALPKAPGRYLGTPTTYYTNHNPSGFTDWVNNRHGQNFEGFGVDVGDYGVRQLGPTNTPAAISGAIKAPSTSVGPNHAYHVSGVAGWASTAADSLVSGGGTGAVGVFGSAKSLATNANIWGFNTVTTDGVPGAGFATPGAWGGEINLNIHNAGTMARGLDIVGGSTVQFNVASPAIIVQTPGLLAPIEVRWGRGLLVWDGSAYTGIEIGTAHNSSNGASGLISSANSGSMPIDFYYRDKSDARIKGGSIDVRSDGVFRIAAGHSAQPVKLQGRKSNGTLTDNITISAGNTGIGALPGLPESPLEVAGLAHLRDGTRTPTANLTPVSAPASPATGFVLYVDSKDNRLKAKSSAGTVTTLANP